MSDPTERPRGARLLAARSRIASRAYCIAPWLALTLVLGPIPAHAYADRAGTDVVMDAPWRCVREDIPVLFFLPQFRGDRRVERLAVWECERGEPIGSPVFVARPGGPDTLGGATCVGPDGAVRPALRADEDIRDFWHVVVRIPHASLNRHASPDVHELRAEVTWTRPGWLGRKRFTNHRVLHVLVDPARFPALGDGDRYFDPHAHSIAEQSSAALFDANSAHKAYGGPLVMLLESAYALGLVETRLRPDGWEAFRDSLAITDHNVFYSGPPYDAGSAPGAGPTAGTDGRGGEAAWYRRNLGRLAGEEVTLRRGSNQDGSPALNLGHHLLLFGGPHLEGPWHGGLVLTSRLENPNTLDRVFEGIAADGAGGFAFAAHPNLEGFVWPPELYARALGWSPHDSRSDPAVDTLRRAFRFRGSEVWNIKMDAAARRSGRLAASSVFDRMNPFPGGPEAQRFEPRVWDAELRRSLDTLYSHVARGLRHAFRETPDQRFVRKLFMVAGSDAHGDFNYSDEVSAVLVPYSGALHSNAFARVRTYVQVHDRPEGDRDPVAAMRDGDALLTDGPVFEYRLDADGRHDPAAGAARWHDAEDRWQNADGRIGGSGAFDGGRTLLVASPGEGVWMRSRWLRSVTPGAADSARFHFERIGPASRDSFLVEAGAPGREVDVRLPVPMNGLCALVASLRDPGVDERCIANPLWVAPVAIDVRIAADSGRALPGQALRPGQLEVTFRFPFSMSPTAGMRVCLRPLDAGGRSTDPEIELAPAPGWEAEEGVAFARFTVVNPLAVPDPPGGWDATTHAASAGARSFVVSLEGPADVHGNVLNDIARTFTLPASGAGLAPDPSPTQRFGSFASSTSTAFSSCSSRPDANAEGSGSTR